MQYPPPPLYKLRPCPSYSRRRDCGGASARRARAGKVLYVRNYPNPSFGPFVEVCCSIIGVFKLLMHVFIHKLGG